MDLGLLLDGLSRPEAYPWPVDRVEVRQTHLSAVFLAGTRAVKVKKPLDLGFVDFTSLGKRREACQDEVTLNRRLAPGVYLGVQPVMAHADGLRLAAADSGREDAVEHAVVMVRLPEDATFAARMARGELGVDRLERLAIRLAAFHASAERGARVTACASFEGLARAARANFEQSVPFAGDTVSSRVLDELARLTEGELAARRPLLESRLARGLARDGHGDLRLEHVYELAHEAGDVGGAGAGRLVIVDCIEFDPGLRCLDPVLDVAFLAMDLESAGRRDLSEGFMEAWRRAADDEGSAALIPLAIAYRHAVRGKVESMASRERELPAPQAEAAWSRARAHFLRGLARLAPPPARPCLVLVGGLPGSGKSTLARGLARAARLEVLSSDVIRKELAGLAPDERAGSVFGEGIYAADWSRRTFDEMERRAEAVLFEGGRALVDASFGRRDVRERFISLAARLGVEALLLLCEVDEITARERLDARRGDPSDADWTVRARMSETWEVPSGAAAAVLRRIDCARPAADVTADALDALVAAGLG